MARPARRPLPEHLPREVRTYVPKQTACPDCGRQMKHLGEDVSEMLEYLPERFKVIRYVRPKLACAALRAHRAGGSAEPTDRAWDCWPRTSGPRAGLEILRSLAVVSSIGNLRARRSGAGSFDTGGLGGWNCSRLLEPLVEVLRRHVMSAEKLHADDTPVPVLAPGNGKDQNGKTVDLCARRSASGR